MLVPRLPTLLRSDSRIGSAENHFSIFWNWLVRVSRTLANNGRVSPVSQSSNVFLSPRGLLLVESLNEIRKRDSKGSDSDIHFGTLTRILQKSHILGPQLTRFKSPTFWDLRSKDSIKGPTFSALLSHRRAQNSLIP